MKDDQMKTHLKSDSSMIVVQLDSMLALCLKSFLQPVMWYLFRNTSHTMMVLVLSISFL